MIASALAVAAALLGIASALLFAIRARDAERALRDAQLRENVRLRGLCQSADADLATTREELRQAKLALVAAETELDLVRQDHGENLSQN